MATKEKQLTALMQLRKLINDSSKLSEPVIEEKNRNAVISTFEVVLGAIDKLIPTERQQLIDAVNYGGNYYDGTKLMAENYYNKTFKTQ